MEISEEKQVQNFLPEPVSSDRETVKAENCKEAVRKAIEKITFKKREVFEKGYSAGFEEGYEQGLQRGKQIREDSINKIVDSILNSIHFDIIERPDDIGNIYYTVGLFIEKIPVTGYGIWVFFKDRLEELEESGYTYYVTYGDFLKETYESDSKIADKQVLWTALENVEARRISTGKMGEGTATEFSNILNKYWKEDFVPIIKDRLLNLLKRWGWL